MSDTVGPDIYCEWNQDLLLTTNGSIQTAIGWDRVRQRIIRNLITVSAGKLPDGTLTAPGYIWHTDFGLSAGKLIGQSPTRAWQHDFIGRVNQAVIADSAVDPGALPSVTFENPQPGTWLVFIVVTLRDRTAGRIVLAIR